MRRSNHSKRTLVGILVGLAMLALWRAGVDTPRPVRAEELTVATDKAERQVLLHIFAVTVDGFTSKDSELDLAKLVDSSIDALPMKTPVVAAIHDEKEFATLKSLLGTRFASKILAKPTLTTQIGRPVSFQSGGETAVQFRPYGVSVDIKSAIAKGGNVWLEIETEHSRLQPPAIESDATNPIIQSRKVNTSVELKAGQTLVLLKNSSEQDGKGDAKEKMLVTITPELVTSLDDELAETTAAPSRVDTRELPKNSVQTFRVQDLKETLELYEGATFFIEADHEIPRLLCHSPNVVEATQMGPRRVMIQAARVGVTSVSLWDKDNKISTFVVSVVSDTRPLARTLKLLFPDLEIEIHDVNGSLLLRGAVHEAKQVEQIIEIAEQYSATILNQLVIGANQSKTSQATQETEVELAKLRQHFGPSHPQIVEREKKTEASQRVGGIDVVPNKPESKAERAPSGLPPQKNRPRLLNEVRLLRQDVRRLIELLEDRLDKDVSSRVEPPSPAMAEERDKSKLPNSWDMSLEEALVIGMRNNKSLTKLKEESAASSRATARSVNFLVQAPSSTTAKSLLGKAERLRRELSQTWLGKELPAWSQPCPISAQIGDKLGAGGTTSFYFRGAEPVFCRMKIQGPIDKIESVLAHEIMHTILATRFNRPLPRWIGEGICLTVKSADEQARMEKELLQLIASQRILPLAELINDPNRSKDVMAVASQGLSLTKHLVEQGGRHRLIQFVEDALESKSWSNALKQHYEYTTLLGLEQAWKQTLEL